LGGPGRGYLEKKGVEKWGGGRWGINVLRRDKRKSYAKMGERINW